MSNHYHIEGYWGEDHFCPPLTLAEANDEMAERADLFADYEAESAYIYLDLAEEQYRPNQPDYVPDEYRLAANAFRAAETYGILAANNRRFQDFPPADNELSRRYSLGLEPGAMGHYVETGELAAYECADPECEELAKAWEEDENY